MVAVISLVMVLTVSILVTRIATIALAHTGLAREAARFQARSAFSGVGFTTAEAEKVVNHPVRRRILMILMLMGNAGIVTVIASLIVAFIDGSGTGSRMLKLAILVAGVAALWTAAHSQWLDRWLSVWVNRLLNRWTSLEVQDYAGLLHLGGDYHVTELHVEPDDWLAGQTLSQLKLRDEGVLVLGIQSPEGEYMGVPEGTTQIEAGDTLLLYGRSKTLKNLDRRRGGASGALSHQDAVVEQLQSARQEQEKLDERRGGTRGKATDSE